MKQSRLRFAVGITAVLLFGPAPRISGQVTAELDAFWTEVSRTVESGDFSGYAATYHPDAVVIFGDATQPISEALAGWEAGFDDTRTGLLEASVAFRFSQRRNDASTAHETGIFRYSAFSPSDDGSVQYVHFEALLVKKGGWMMMMEFQRGPATEAEWAALGGEQ
jgi:ketosteroid isomerase-like protein